MEEQQHIQASSGGLQPGEESLAVLASPCFWAGQSLANRLILAPLAGPGERVFRALCEHYGAALQYTELCSVRSILYDPELVKNRRYLSLEGLRGPSVIQLFGAEAEDFARAIPRLLRSPHYEDCAAIDINMGCPVQKVVKTGAGSALLRDLPRAQAIVRASVEAAAPFNKAVTVKFRLGWDAASGDQAPHFASALEAAGAAALALHCRTREAFYGGQADWSWLAPVKAAIHIPLAANGDIRTAAEAASLLSSGVCDAVMIGRAAIGRPWIFAEMLAAARGTSFTPPQGAALAALMRRHFEGLAAFIGEYAAVREFRPSLAAYLAGRPGAAQLRREAMQIQEADALRAFLEDRL